ncbi:MAG: hypothetical protein ABSE49_20600 [Polyangiaceae bacterium]|jgi:hypothetical protein
MPYVPGAIGELSLREEGARACGVVTFVAVERKEGGVSEAMAQQNRSGDRVELLVLDEQAREAAAWLSENGWSLEPVPPSPEPLA